jgi:hypothetical protein
MLGDGVTADEIRAVLEAYPVEAALAVWSARVALIGRGGGRHDLANRCVSVCAQQDEALKAEGWVIIDEPEPRWRR